MASPVKALDVAAQLLWYSNEATRQLTPMQILKLVYISHGWTLGLLSRPLIHEAVEAWRYGPVVPIVYKKYRRYRRNPIEDPVDDRRGLMDEDQNEVVRQVSEKYARFSGVQLSIADASARFALGPHLEIRVDRDPEPDHRGPLPSTSERVGGTRQCLTSSCPTSTPSRTLTKTRPPKRKRLAKTSWHYLGAPQLRDLRSVALTAVRYFRRLVD